MPAIDKKQINLNNSLGTLLELEQGSNGVTGKTENGNFRITIYSDEIIRVHISKDDDFEKRSYAVVMQPAEADFFLEEVNGIYMITAGKMVLKIQKDPVRFTFLTKDGKIINEDDQAFGTSWIGEKATTYKKMQEGERFLGLGEKTGPLDKRGRGYENWNTDSFAYHSEQDPLYSTIPFYLGVHSDLAYGIFFDNSHKSHFNFGASNDRFSSFSSDAGDMDYYFFHDSSVGGIIKAYSQLTGFAEIPPLWSLGYQQCRYSYYPEQEVYSLIRTFREKDIPADTVVFDIHYMDKYKIFSWDEKRFPDPKRMINDLKEAGFNTVVMCDPGIKIEEGYEPYEDGVEKDVFIKYPDGENYSGEVWPGWCHFPDFTKPETREWWGEKMTYYIDQGVTGFWNDMNEIATWGQTLPDLMEMDFDGDKSTMREGRNLFGLQMARSTFEGTKSRLGGKRPFNLTRSSYAGIQRYSALWTGDNVSDEEHMLLGVRLLNNLGLAGIPFTGYDVGGFAGNATEHMFARWIQLGALSPFFRGHTMINSRDSEPWTFGEEVEEISRNYIKLRYKLMPYLYSAFKEANSTGLPIVRSLAIEHPHDAKIYDALYHNQYFFGESMMVAPVESYKDLVKTYLPGEGKWYEFFTDKVYDSGEIIAESPIQQLPVFVKSSGIISVSPNIGDNTNDLGDLLEFHIYNGTESNTFSYYEDDGSTYEYESGAFYQRNITFDPENRKIKISAIDGSLKSRFSKLKICLHGFDFDSVDVNGSSVNLDRGTYRFIQPISSFDPQGQVAAEHLKIADLPSFEMNNDAEAIEVNW